MTVGVPSNASRSRTLWRSKTRLIPAGHSSRAEGSNIPQVQQHIFLNTLNTRCTLHDLYATKPPAQQCCWEMEMEGVSCGQASYRAEPCSHPAPVLLPGTSEIRKHRWHFAPDEQHTVDRAEAPTPQVAAAPSLRPADTKQRVAEKEGEHRGLAKGMCLCPVLALPRCRAAGSDATIRWQCVGCARGQTGTPRGVLAGQALHSRALPGD